MMDVLTNLIVPITSQYICASNHYEYTLNIHDAVCQLDLNMLGEKENKNTDFTLKRKLVTLALKAPKGSSSRSKC